MHNKQNINMSTFKRYILEKKHFKNGFYNMPYLNIDGNVSLSI